MAQNIYDNPDFFAGYSQIPRQVRGLDGAPEWPTIREMLPAVSDKRVVDLGCGFGWASRWMREHGATAVLGLDISDNMIRRATADTTDPKIEYRIADLETLELPTEAFDLAYSSLTFHYVRDFDRLIRMLHQALVPGGHIVFTIEHPSSWQRSIRTGLSTRTVARPGRSIAMPSRASARQTGLQRGSSNITGPSPQG